jgi:two-component system CheB/CheR fusion protein
VAILIRESLDALGKDVPVKIFATDVHRASLEFASAALYPEASLADMSPERLARYFTRKGDVYQVSQELRKMVVFAPHNVLKDAPFTKLDLITCRNLLIYFQPSAQKKVLSLFHFGLKTGGVLFLGPSECAGDRPVRQRALLGVQVVDGDLLLAGDRHVHVGVGERGQAASQQQGGTGQEPHQCTSSGW